MNLREQPEAAIERAGYSVKEFSALFGKNRDWGYRQIKMRRVTPTVGFGTMIVPVQEVKRILGK